jgi:hypothetical protein
MKIDCPKCGVSYDTNLDPIEYEVRRQVNEDRSYDYARE